MASVEIAITAVDSGNSCIIEISVDLYIKYQFIRESHVMVTNRDFLLISHKHGLLHNNKK